MRRIRILNLLTKIHAMKNKPFRMIKESGTFAAKKKLFAVLYIRNQNIVNGLNLVDTIIGLLFFFAFIYLASLT